jgi:hypothetical protein
LAATTQASPAAPDPVPAPTVSESTSDQIATAVKDATAASSTLLVYGENLYAAVKGALATAQAGLATLRNSSAAGYPGTTVSNAIQAWEAHADALQAALTAFEQATGKN